MEQWPDGTRDETSKEEILLEVGSRRAVRPASTAGVDAAHHAPQQRDVHLQARQSLIVNDRLQALYARVLARMRNAQ